MRFAKRSCLLAVANLLTLPIMAETTQPRRYSLYTPELQLLAETELTTSDVPAIAYEYIWFNGRPVAQIETATNVVHTYLTDHLGTPILTTSSSGAVDWRAEYEPYGAVFSLRAGAERHQPLRFPGQEFDAATDREYNVFRWYRAGWGRYTQADPLTLRGDPIFWTVLKTLDVPSPPLPYAYTEGDPLTEMDAFGLTVKRCFRMFSGKTAKTLAVVGFELGWVYVQPPIPGVTHCLMHEYLYNTQTQTSQGYDPNEATQETMKHAICYDIPEPLGQCVWDNFSKVSGKPNAYNVLRHNCQIAINQTVLYCKCRSAAN